MFIQGRSNITEREVDSCGEPWNPSNFIKNIITEDLSSGKVQEVVTRFPPEPNGYLHIGHAKAIWINFTLADEFGGKTNLRFDDTNPLKEDTEYVNSIKEDVKWLGYEWEELRFASDYFNEMYERAELLIQKGKAYVDDLSADQIRELRGTLTEPGKTARTASAAAKRVLTCSGVCVQVNSRTGKRCCVPRLTWLRRILTCATRLSTGFRIPITIIQAMPGVSTRCIPLPIRWRMLLKP